MEKARMFVGRLNEDPSSIESYQLLVDCECTSYYFDPEDFYGRDLFYDEICGIFVKRMSLTREILEVSTFNGVRINPDTQELEGILRLEDELITQLAGSLRNQFAMQEEMFLEPGVVN